MLAMTLDRPEHSTADSLEPTLLVSRFSTQAGDGTSRHRLAEPERRLLLAVLIDAIVRVDRLATAAPGAARDALLEAERWIRSNDRRWPCSFVNVCEALGIAHLPLRQAVLRWRAAADSRRQINRRRLLVGLVVEGQDA